MEWASVEAVAVDSVETGVTAWLRGHCPSVQGAAEVALDALQRVEVPPVAAQVLREFSVAAVQADRVSTALRAERTAAAAPLAAAIPVLARARAVARMARIPRAPAVPAVDLAAVAVAAWILPG